MYGVWWNGCERVYVNGCGDWELLWCPVFVIDYKNDECICIFLELAMYACNVFFCSHLDIHPQDDIIIHSLQFFSGLRNNPTWEHGNYVELQTNDHRVG